MAVLWEQQEGESLKVYSYFARYRDQGAERSIAGTAREMGISRKWAQDCCTKWEWHERAAAFDRYTDSRMLAVRQTDLEGYAASINASLQLNLAAARTIADGALRAMREKQEKAQGAIDLLEFNRLLGAITTIDSLSRRSAGMATAFVREKATADESDEDIFYVGLPSEDDE